MQVPDHQIDPFVQDLELGSMLGVGNEGRLWGRYMLMAFTV
jgi:hypothetical protein